MGQFVDLKIRIFGLFRAFLHVQQLQLQQESIKCHKNINAPSLSCCLGAGTIPPGLNHCLKLERHSRGIRNVDAQYWGWGGVPLGTYKKIYYLQSKMALNRKESKSGCCQGLLGQLESREQFYILIHCIRDTTCIHLSCSNESYDNCSAEFGCN